MCSELLAARPGTRGAQLKVRERSVYAVSLTLRRCAGESTHTHTQTHAVTKRSSAESIEAAGVASDVRESEFCSIRWYTTGCALICREVGMIYHGCGTWTRILQAGGELWFFGLIGGPRFFEGEYGGS